MVSPTTTTLLISGGGRVEESQLLRQGRKQAKEQDTPRTRGPATGKRQLRKQESERQGLLTLPRRSYGLTQGLQAGKGHRVTGSNDGSMRSKGRVL